MPTRPGCTTPHIRFLFPGSSPGQALALLLAFGSAYTWRKDSHLASSVPCPAHTPKSAAAFTPSAGLICSLMVFVAFPSNWEVLLQWLRSKASQEQCLSHPAK